MRTARDTTLAMPALILPAVQINMRAADYRWWKITARVTWKFP